MDWFFDLFAGPRSALLVLLSNPKNSVGGTRGLRSKVFEHRRLDPGGSQIALHLDKLAPLLGPLEVRAPRIHVTEAERHMARVRYGLDAEREEVFIHPGASWPWRQWSLDRWPSLVSAVLAERPGCRIHVVTAPGDEEVSRGLVRACPGDVEPLPVLGLRDLFSALSWGRLYVGNDGGVLHAAVALGVPTVAIIGGENDPDVWFPYADLGPYRAVRRVSAEAEPASGGVETAFPDADPEEVMKVVREVLAASGPSRPSIAPDLAGLG